MLIGRKPDILASEITPQELYGRRRELIKAAGAASVLAGISALSLFALPRGVHAGAKLANVRKSPFTVNEEMTSLKDISTYNNFYEFGTDKDDPAAQRPHAQDPALDGQGGGRGQETRTTTSTNCSSSRRWRNAIYRMRCVEGWSMVIPWVGYPAFAS